MEHEWSEGGSLPGDLARTCLTQGIDAVECDAIYRQLHVQSLGVLDSPLSEHAEIQLEAAAPSTGEEIAGIASCGSRLSSDSAPLISIIIPSLGRIGLSATLESLDAQVDSDFEAILILDGITASASAVSPRPWLCVEEMATRQGTGNSGGAARNRGLSLARGTLVGFVDDDDTVGPDYVHHVRQEYAIDDGTSGAYVFRMATDSPFVPVLPPPYARTLVHKQFGISFAVQRYLVQSYQLRFNPSVREDVDFLIQVGRLAPVTISPAITYFVRLPPSSRRSISGALVASLPRVVVPAGEGARGGVVLRDEVSTRLARDGGLIAPGPHVPNPREGPLIALAMSVHVTAMDGVGAAQDFVVRHGETVEVAVGAFCKTHSLVGKQCWALLEGARERILRGGKELLVGVGDGRLYQNPSLGEAPPGTIQASEITDYDAPVLFIG